jgi:transcriptional regulator with XRE-family HTH domain
MSDELRAFVSEEIKKRGWSQRKLARQSDTSHPLISQVLSGDVPPSADFCIKVAQALGEPPEKLLRLAGILPPTSDDPTLEELNNIIKNLSPQARQELLSYARFRLRQEKD